jgi:hypothetical protein
VSLVKEVVGKLRVEDCGPRNRNSNEYDAERQYCIQSPSFQAEGEIYFYSRPSKLDDTLDDLLKTKSVSSTGGVRTVYVNSSNSVASDPSRRNRFMTRDPIYAIPAGDTKKLLTDVVQSVTGNEVEPVVDVFLDMLDEYISPRKRRF